MQRDPRFDIFRGLALIAITVNHTVGPNGLNLKFGQLWFFDFAELFVLISGLVCGMAYYKRLQSDGFSLCQRHALKRAGTLYLANLITFLLCLWLVSEWDDGGETSHYIERMRQFMTDPYPHLASVLLLIKPPFLLGVLGFYMVMVALAPTAITLYTRRRLAAVGLSLAGYLFVQLQSSYGWHDPLAGVLEFGNPLALQFLFCLGLWLGVESSRGRLSLPQSHKAVTMSIAALVAGGVARKYQLIDAGWWSDPGMVKPLSIIELLTLCYLIAVLLPAKSRLWKTEWLFPFAACGKRPLVVYCSGVVISYWVILASHSQDFERARFLLHNAIGVGLLVMVAMMLQFYEDWRLLPDGEEKMAPN